MADLAAIFARFGAEPRFAAPIQTGQRNLPPLDAVELAFRGIFDRRYYANNGPLVQDSDRDIARFLGVNHAVCTTNEGAAMMTLLKGLELSGDVIVPALVPASTVAALRWAGLTPVICDVNEQSLDVTCDAVGSLLTEQTTAICGFHPWGQAHGIKALQTLADRHGLALLYDASQAFGCTHRGRMIGTFGIAEIFSFSASTVLNAAEGGCISTDDEQLAAKCRTIRSFSDSPVRVALRMNGKMSEAQAALALLNLEALPDTIGANRARYAAYDKGLADMPGVRLVAYNLEEQSHFSYVVIEIDDVHAELGRDAFFELLSAENVVCSRPFEYAAFQTVGNDCGAQDARLFPVAHRCAKRLLELPNGQIVSIADVERICELIRQIRHHSQEIGAALKEQS